MVQDNYWRGFFILALGLFIPVVSHLISLDGSVAAISQGFLYFILVYLVNWMVCRALTLPIRNRFPLLHSPILKMVLFCAVNCVITATIIFSAGYFWYQHVNAVEWKSVELATIFSTVAGAVFTLLFEVAYLSHEREEDIRTVHQLDKKRYKAELRALRNELDPHFMFNALTTLTQLIPRDEKKAEQYTRKLSQVYKYFLVNRQREFIPLADELDFITDYCYLLQIRYGNRLQLDISYEQGSVEDYMILPCALQIPVENAVKHNEVSDEHPLIIRIHVKEDHLVVRNCLAPKTYELPSTQIGLQNLRRRYKLACNESIDVRQNGSEFIVELPLITRYLCSRL